MNNFPCKHDGRQTLCISIDLVCWSFKQIYTSLTVNTFSLATVLCWLEHLQVQCSVLWAVTNNTVYKRSKSETDAWKATAALWARLIRNTIADWQTKTALGLLRIQQLTTEAVRWLNSHSVECTLKQTILYGDWVRSRAHVVLGIVK